MPFVVVKVKIWGRFGVLIGLLEGNLRSGEDTEKKERNGKTRIVGSAKMRRKNNINNNNNKTKIII